MKIERKKPQPAFEPVVITLESKEEARDLLFIIIAGKDAHFFPISDNIINLANSLDKFLRS